MDLTGWFEASQKPDLEGWYERDWGDDVSTAIRDYWDGEKWMLGDVDGDICQVSTVKLRWRGLAEDPNGSKP